VDHLSAVFSTAGKLREGFILDIPVAASSVTAPFYCNKRLVETFKWGGIGIAGKPELARFNWSSRSGTNGHGQERPLTLNRAIEVGGVGIVNNTNDGFLANS